MHPSKTAARLEARLAALEQMELEPLRAEWRKLYRIAPPPRLSCDLMARGIAYKLQEAAFGSLLPAAQRQLAATAKISRMDGEGRALAPASLRPGATLVRSWRGQTHTVRVLADGYEHQGQRYPSLSHIARAITGAHWSGPRFFGLTASSPASVS